MPLAANRTVKMMTGHKFMPLVCMLMQINSYILSVYIFSGEINMICWRLHYKGDWKNELPCPETKWKDASDLCHSNYRWRFKISNNYKYFILWNTDMFYSSSRIVQFCRSWVVFAYLPCQNAMFFFYIQINHYNVELYSCSFNYECSSKASFYYFY